MFTTSFGTTYYNENQIWDNTFHKRVKSSKHYFKLHNAWGMGLDTLEELRANGVEKIEIYDTEDKLTYRTTVEKFLTKGISGNFGKAGQQKFLPITPSNYEHPYN